MEEMASLWRHQESIEELKLKIHYTSLELEAVKAKANEELNKNTESVKQLLQILKFVCHERDEAREQIQKLLNKITPFVNNPVFSDCLTIDQLHQLYQSPLMKPLKGNSSIAQSNSPSDAYNHCSSPVDSHSDPVTCPEFSNTKTNNSLVQDYRQEVMLSNGFQAMSSIPKLDYPTLMMESMIKGKVLTQKGNLLQAVMEAGPLLQTLLATYPLPRWQKQSQTFVDMSAASFLQMSGGGNQICGGNILSFDDLNFSQYQGRMELGFPRANNSGLVAKRQSPAGSPGLPSSKWSPIVIAMVGTMGTLFLVFSYFNVLRRCTFRSILSSENGQRMRLSDRNLDGNDPSLQYHSRGLDTLTVKMIPVTQFKKKSESYKVSQSDQDEGTECAICLGEYEDDEWVKSIPNCFHVFHESCINTWFETHSSCPLCRSHLSGQSFEQNLIREDVDEERSVFYQSLHSHILQNSNLARPAS
nr:RING-H2 finger protein ATL1-like [Tanacetum cinerariifolium]